MRWRLLGRRQRNSRVVVNKEEDQRENAFDSVQMCVSARFSSTCELFDWMTPALPAKYPEFHSGSDAGMCFLSLSLSLCFSLLPVSFQE